MSADGCVCVVPTALSIQFGVTQHKIMNNGAYDAHTDTRTTVHDRTRLYFVSNTIYSSSAHISINEFIERRPLTRATI